MRGLGGRSVMIRSGDLRGSWGWTLCSSVKTARMVLKWVFGEIMERSRNVAS